MIPLRIGSKQYYWKFTIADVSRPLLGADFLRSNALLVDLRRKRLVDAETYLSAPLGKTGSLAPHLSAISAATNEYDKLLAEFPEISRPNFIIIIIIIIIITSRIPFTNGAFLVVNY